MSALLAEHDEPVGQLLGALVLQCRHDWSPELSRAVLAWLRRETAQETVDVALRNQLKELARRLAPATLAEATTGWKTDAKGWELWSKSVDGLLAVAQFRLDLRAAVNL